MKNCSNLLAFYFCFSDDGKSSWIQVNQVQNMTGWRTERLRAIAYLLPHEFEVKNQFFNHCKIILIVWKVKDI